LLRADLNNTVWVVGGDDRVREMARGLGGICLDELGEDLNDTLKKAFELAFEQGKSALYVAGDLPFLKPADILSMLQASRSRGNVTLAPARRDGGTNAILVPVGVALQPFWHIDFLLEYCLPARPYLARSLHKRNTRSRRGSHASWS
jgi:2-phospho-L-lactate guanylyltransferase (CobY/MobA/RfbA family)